MSSLQGMDASEGASEDTYAESFNEIPARSTGSPITPSASSRDGLGPPQQDQAKTPVDYSTAHQTYEHPAIHIPFNSLDNQTLATLSGKGDILSVLINLNKLFHPHSLKTLYSTPVLKQNPHLPFLLICHAECTITVKMLDPHLFNSLSLDVDQLFHLLGYLGDTVIVGHDIRARAKALRVVRTFGWQTGIAHPIWASTSSEAESPITLQLKVVQEITDAKRLNKQDTFVLFVICLVKRALARSFEEDYVKAMALQEIGIRRDDLFATFIWFNLTLRTALDRNNAAVVSAMIRTIAEMEKIGEWGMLVSNWWKTQELAYMKVDLYRTEHEKGYHGTGMPDLFPKTYVRSYTHAHPLILPETLAVRRGRPAETSSHHHPSGKAPASVRTTTSDASTLAPPDPRYHQQVAKSKLTEKWIYDLPAMDDLEFYQDTENDPKNADEGSFLHSAQYSDTTIVATFSITFPVRLSQMIMDNSVMLTEKVKNLRGKYIFEAGYDVVPCGFTVLIPEQLQCFQGTREMLWMTCFDIDPSENLTREEREKGLAETHYPIMLSIATELYSPVALLDLGTGVALAYDKETMTGGNEDESFEVKSTSGANSSDSVERLYSSSTDAEPRNLNTFVHPSSSCSTRTEGNTSTQQQETTGTSASSMIQRQQAEDDQQGIAPNGRRGGEGGGRGTGDEDGDINERPPGSDPEPPSDATDDPIRSQPFICKVDVIGLHGKGQEIGIALHLKAEHLHTDVGREERNRSSCCITAESFEAKVTDLKSSDRSDLQLEEIHLQLGPTITTFEGEEIEREKYEAQMYASNPKPSEALLRGVTITESQTTTAALQGNLPQAVSVAFSKQAANSETQSPDVYGYRRKWIRAGGAERSCLHWVYPIEQRSTGNRGESPVSRHAPYKSHSGEFSYPSHMPPTSQRIQLLVLCGIPRLTLRPAINDVFSKFIPGCVEHKGKFYPCRNLCLKLCIDILPTYHGKFLYPRSPATGYFLDLGRVTFVEQNGLLCMKVDRKTTRPIRLGPGLPQNYVMQQGQWKIVAHDGKLEISERDDDPEDIGFETIGSLDFGVVNAARKRLQPPI